MVKNILCNKRLEFLESHDRNKREEVYRKIQDRRLEDTAPLNDLYNQLIAKRNQEAINAGFANYRDYRFKELGRLIIPKKIVFNFTMR